jgi:5-methyltetrahydrofolate--homocysteine methyltransferase
VTPIFAPSPTNPGPTAVPRPPVGREPARLLDATGGGPLVLDAGMGTRLLARGLDLRIDDPCLWNLDRPEHVLDVHRRDAAAGSRVLLTNTFGANRAWLARLGRRGDLEAINRAGADLARRAAGPSGFVVGDIGASAADEPGAADEQAAVLIDAGVDAIILETFLLESALAAMRGLRPNMASSAVPRIVGLWRWPGAIEDAARRLVDAGADIIGINCRPAMSGALAVVRRLAGCDSTPAAFAAALPALVEYNVRLIGGCCGTSEAHVAALATARAIPRNPQRPDTHEPRGAAT